MHKCRIRRNNRDVRLVNYAFLPGPNHLALGAVVVAQLAERSLPTPEIRGSNPNIDNNKFVFERNHLSIATQKRHIKKKMPGIARLKKII